MEKAVLVTGADRGLGFELVKKFMDDGYFVFACRYMKKWDLLQKLAEQYPEQLAIVDIDISSDKSVKEALKAVKEKTTKLDMLINVAGVPLGLKGTIFDELDFDEMIAAFNINALGSLRVVNALINELMNGFHKLIVNISSEAGSIGTCWRYDSFGYCMSKAAINMQAAIIHNSLHREFNGQVMCFHPGGMQSYFLNNQGPETPISELGNKTFLSYETSADNIYSLIMDQERFKSDHPAFINYKGDRIPW